MTTPLYLGKTVTGPISADGLDWFPAPDDIDEVRFTSHELQAICPVTNQPDVYDLSITYKPAARCVESKSLKLYLTSFRDQGVYAEALAVRIAADILTAIEPEWVEVKTTQQVRGGLRLTTKVYRER